MPADPDLEVHVRTSEGAFQGRCIDLESDLHEILASVEFPADKAPALPLGAKTELEFRGGLDFSLRAEARAVLRTDDASRRCYCFRGPLTKSALLSLMDRRRSSRVRPPASEPVRVRILDLGADSPEVLLHDLSATGLSILVEPELEQRLCRHLRLRLAVRLSGEEQEVEMATTVRHRRVVGSAILYGLEIDGQIPELMRAHNRFLVYVRSIRDHGPDLDQGIQEAAAERA
jgi:c-di-GMP-binding flagellar brake protein YcgR